MVSKAVRRPIAVVAALMWIWPAIAQDGGEPDASLKSQYDAAFQEMFADPGNLDIMFRFAKLATRLGDLEAAIATLERMLIYNRDLPRVRLELGALYFRLGAYATSQTYLATATESDEVPELVHERVGAYTAEIAERESRHRFTGVVSGGVRYQSNANAGPASAEVRAAGFDAILEDEFLGKSDFNLFVAAEVKHDFDLHTQQSDTWQTTGAAYLSRHLDLSELDLAVLEATTGPRLALLREIIDGVSVRPYGLANLVLLEDAMYFNTFGFGLHLGKQFGSRVLVEGGYEFRRKLFQNSDRNPTADEFSGYEQRVRMRSLYSATDDVLFSFQFSAAFDDAEKDYNSNRELAGSAGVSIRYDAPFELTGWPWRFSVSAARILTDYYDPDPAVDPGVTRSDRKSRITVSNSFGIARNWSIFAQFQHTIADSNLPNFEFDNSVALIGVSRSFATGGG